MDLSYTVMVNVETSVSDAELRGRLHGYEPVVSPAGAGYREVVLTFMAGGLREAVATGLDRVEAAAGGPAIEVEATTTQAVTEWFEHPAADGVRRPSGTREPAYSMPGEQSEAVR